MRKAVLAFLIGIIICVCSVSCIAFGETKGTEEIFSSGAWEYFLNDDGTITISKWVGYGSSIEIPGELDGHQVKVIGTEAFAGYDAMTSLTIPDTVSVIEDYAFLNCTRLEEITIPSSANSIGVGAFLHCFSLTNIIIAPDNEYYYVMDNALVEKKTMTLVCYLCGASDEEYYIPEEINGVKDLAFAGCENLTSIIIPESVKNIEEGAFSSCKNLKSIIVSPDNDNYASIDNVLFEKQTKTLICYPNGLSDEEYSIPEGIEAIGVNAFYDCDYLMGITIPDSVTEIKMYAFSYSDNLKSITVPDSVTSIEGGAFSNCINLTGIELPDSIAAIEMYLFKSCESLEDIIIPESVYRIEEGAFTGCVSLKHITLPSYVTEIGEEVFQDCDSLENIEVVKDSYAAKYVKEKDLPYSYTDANDWLTNNDNETVDYSETDESNEIPVAGDYEYTVNPDDSVTITAYVGEEEIIEIPETIDGKQVKTIGFHAFYDCKTAKSIEVPASVSVVESYTFSGCPNLSEIILPDSITSIGEYAFALCPNLTSVDLPGSLSVIANSLFFQCEKLAEVHIPESVIEIKEFAFHQCYNLSSIVIPASVSSIAPEAFSDSIEYDGWDKIIHSINVTLIVKSGSYAEQYAIENGIAYTYSD